MSTKTKEVVTVSTSSDVGSIRIKFGNRGTALFSNRGGDGGNIINIGESAPDYGGVEGTFGVSEGAVATLQSHDVGRSEPVYEFGEGQWMVQVPEPWKVYIHRFDDYRA